MTVSKDTTFLLLHAELSNTSKQLKEHKAVLENLVDQDSYATYVTHILYLCICSGELMAVLF